MTANDTTRRVAESAETKTHGGMIAAEAADRGRLASLRASSELLRAREMSGFSLGRDRVDVRGWQVYDRDAVLVGSVDSLFVDMHTKSVRYLGVTLTNPRTKGTAGTVLVPVGAISRADDQRAVVLSDLSRGQLLSAPRLANRPVTRTDENAALGAYGLATWRDVAGRDLYRGSIFDERRLFGDPRSRA